MSHGDLRSIKDVEDAVAGLELSDIAFFTLAVTRDPEAHGTEGESGARVDFGTAYRTVDDGVDYRCAVNFVDSSKELSITVDAAALYRADGPISIEPVAIAEFGENVAVMALFPYLRQALDDLGRRVGADVVLPVLHRGEITFEVPGVEEA